MSAARAIALALAAIAVGAIVGVLVLARSEPEAAPPTRFDRTIAVRTSVEPSVHLFGDPVTAHVDLRFDRRRVRPDSVVLDTLFRPYEQVGPARRVQREVGENVHLRISYPLQCLGRPCSPGAPRRQIRFPPLRVMYVLRDVRARATDTAEWPPVDVTSRLGASDIQEARWRADLEPPPVEYRARPGRLAAGLGGAALLLALGGSLLTWRLLERRPDEDDDEAPIETRPPLERILEHVGLVSANGDAPERRRALERLARELDRAGKPVLSARARKLAWAPGEPQPAEIQRLVGDVEAATGGGG